MLAVGAVSSTVSVPTGTSLVIESSAVVNPIVVTDRGAVPAAGKTKLQVANFAR